LLLTNEENAACKSLTKSKSILIPINTPFFGFIVVKNKYQIICTNDYMPIFKKQPPTEKKMGDLTLLDCFVIGVLMIIIFILAMWLRRTIKYNNQVIDAEIRVLAAKHEKVMKLLHSLFPEGKNVYIGTLQGIYKRFTNEFTADPGLPKNPRAMGRIMRELRQVDYIYGLEIVKLRDSDKGIIYQITRK